MVHRHAAAEDDLQQRLEGQDAGDGGERVVLADGVTAGDRVLDEDTGLAHLGDLGDGQRGHRDLGELGQEEHAVGVAVQLTVGPQLGRVVAHHGEDREAERLAGVLVGAVPDLAGAAERVRASRPMPWLWMPWPGKAYAVRGAATTAWATMASSPSARQVTSTTSIAAEDAGALDGDLHLGARLQRGDPAGQPAADPRGWWVAPTEAAARWATAESHMPCTIGPSKPARRAAGRRCAAGCGRR